ncbi:MAG: methyltransferase domain-containing protein [Candidatus Methanoperedens sp.]|nr:methyltransferase domain-containing protein [Candidatus Methanoperedens sp.]
MRTVGQFKQKTKPELIFQKEETFHDTWAESINIDEVIVDGFFEAYTSPENRMILSVLGDIKGKKILELGCGAGEASVYFARKGADVTAADISSGMLEVVQKVAEKYNVSLQTTKCYSHKIYFEDESFDIVYAANLLHHVDIESTVVEVHRVLKKGGIFVSWDPLAHNPAINVYRRIATKVRTQDEHPLKMNDLKIFKKYFSRVESDATWFFTLWIFIKFYFIDRINPNKERYWKKILIEHKKLEKMYKSLDKIDTLFFKLFPFMKKYCWNIIIFSYK